MKTLQHHWLRTLPGIAAVCLTLSLTAQAQTPYYADAGRLDDSGDGLTWPTAKQTIQAAVDLTSDGDTVWVANGIYLVTTNIMVTNAITLIGVNGSEATHLSRTAGGSKRILYLDHSDAVIEGFTIRDGSGLTGAGIFMTGGTVRDCVVSNNVLGMNQGVGAGIRMLGGAVLDCRIVNNRGSGHGTHGAGIYASGGLISDCVITSNTTDAGSTTYRASGAGVFLSGAAILRNSLVAANNAQRGGHGGGVYLTGAASLVESCTIVHNTSAWQEGGGVYLAGGTVRNSIVYFNQAPNYPDTANVRLGGSGLEYSCATPFAAGMGNTDRDPRFVDQTTGNYRLLPGSPCLDTGTNQAWMADARDLDGNARILPLNGITDMGCHEYVRGALACDFTADVSAGMTPLTVTFSAFVEGANTNGLYYAWDLNGDGIVDTEGHDRHAVSREYPAGIFSVSLYVRNSIGETDDRTRAGYIRVSAPILYVCPAGSAEAPFADWSTAANDIQTAIDLSADGAEIIVRGELYSVTQQIMLEKGVVLRRDDGPGGTTIRAGIGGIRVITVDHPDAVLEGFTIQDGSGMAGAGVHLTDGTIRDCVVSNNVLGMNQGVGAGIRMFDGVVLRCRIVNNRTTGHGTHGAGIYASSGMISDCIITNNTTDAGSTTYRASGAGVFLTGGAILRNSLVTTNNAQRGGHGGGVYLAGAASLVENCTLAHNTSGWEEGGGIYLGGGAVRNSIVYFNQAPNYPDTANVRLGGSGLIYSCTTPLPAGSGNIAADPLFVDAAASDYRLSILPDISPCIDAGTNQDWMTGATDLDGNPRIRRGRIHEALPEIVDMGAFEYNAPRKGVFLMLR